MGCQQFHPQDNRLLQRRKARVQLPHVLPDVAVSSDALLAEGSDKWKSGAYAGARDDWQSAKRVILCVSNYKAKQGVNRRGCYE